MSSPSGLVLDGKAEYVEDGDTVLISIYFQDKEQEVGFPGYVHSGYCALMYRNQEVNRIDFDRRFGNGEGADGDFIFQFMHPSFNRDMKVHVQLIANIPHISGAKTFKKTIPVTMADKPYIPLEAQPDTGADANEELRSQKRIKEEL
jgi:hypothetical protein